MGSRSRADGGVWRLGLTALLLLGDVWEGWRRGLQLLVLLQLILLACASNIICKPQSHFKISQRLLDCLRTVGSLEGMPSPPRFGACWVMEPKVSCPGVKDPRAEIAQRRRQSSGDHHQCLPTALPHRERRGGLSQPAATAAGSSSRQTAFTHQTTIQLFYCFICDPHNSTYIVHTRERACHTDHRSMADDVAGEEATHEEQQPENQQRQRPHQSFGDTPWEPGKSRVEPETLAYLTEVSAHLETLDDPEERELLLNNVLEELEGKELRVAADAVCSRLLETLLAPAAPRHLIAFMEAFTTEDAMYKLAGSAFGSHVAEGLLQRLGAAADGGGLPEEDAAALEQLLDALAGALGDQLYDYLMDRHATHVARALLRVGAGRDVVPASKQGKQKQQDGKSRGGGGGGAGGVGVNALAEKLSGSHGATAPLRFPQLVSRLARMLPCYDPPSMAVLAKNTYSGPFLQGVLRAVAGDRCAAAGAVVVGGGGGGGGALSRWCVCVVWLVAVVEHPCLPHPNPTHQPEPPPHATDAVRC